MTPNRTLQGEALTDRKIYQTALAPRLGRRGRANVAMSVSPERRKSRKSTPRYLQLSATLRSVRYSSMPFFVEEPAMMSRSLAKRLDCVFSIVVVPRHSVVLEEGE